MWRLTFLSPSDIADEKVVFSNYRERYENGQIAQIPKIIGTTAREASPLVPYPEDVEAGPSEEAITERTLSTVCMAYNTSVIREESGLQTWRYEWAGNFTNISPLPWLGAYHYADLYMFFGTYPIAPGEISELEVDTANVMQDLLVAFAKDPTSLPEAGWPEYKPSEEEGGKIARFGTGGKAVQYVAGDDVEGACHIPGKEYDTTP